MASRLRLAASLLAVVGLVLLGTTAAIAANGNGNGNGNGQANGQSTGNGNNQSTGNGNNQSTGNGNSQSNGNGNSQSNGNDNSQSNGNDNSQSNGNGNGQSNGDGDGDTPVTICHNPSTDASTLSVNDSAVQAHLAHGDHLGACTEGAADEEGEGDDQQETTDDEQTTDEETSEPQGDDSPPVQDPSPTSLVPATGSPASASGETRSLYCSTQGPIDRGNGEPPGVALNLPESQGAPLVEKGLVTPAIFYAGLGVSCDVLPGYLYAGFWVDNVGDVVAGVSVYPYYVPAS